VLSQHQLKEMLYYDPVTGIFTWLKLPYNMVGLTGSRAGSIYANGYRYIQIGNRAYRTGRLAWLYMTGEWPVKLVDHEDLVKSNDAWINLRLANDSQNGANKGLASNNTSGTKGVRFETSRGKWRAQITVNGHSKNLGRYTSREKAMNAYERAAKAAWGEFART
jgi:HNH endonuclease